MSHQHQYQHHQQQKYHNQNDNNGDRSVRSEDELIHRTNNRNNDKHILSNTPTSTHSLQYSPNSYIDYTEIIRNNHNNHQHQHQQEQQHVQQVNLSFEELMNSSPIFPDARQDEYKHQKVWEELVESPGREQKQQLERPWLNDVSPNNKSTIHSSNNGVSIATSSTNSRRHYGRLSPMQTSDGLELINKSFNGSSTAASSAKNNNSSTVPSSSIESFNSNIRNDNGSDGCQSVNNIPSGRHSISSSTRKTIMSNSNSHGNSSSNNVRSQNSHNGSDFSLPRRRTLSSNNSSSSSTATRNSNTNSNVFINKSSSIGSSVFEAEEDQREEYATAIITPQSVNSSGSNSSHTTTHTPYNNPTITTNELSVVSSSNNNHPIINYNTQNKIPISTAVRTTTTTTEIHRKRSNNNKNNNDSKEQIVRYKWKKQLASAFREILLEMEQLYTLRCSATDQNDIEFWDKQILSLKECALQLCEDPDDDNEEQQEDDDDTNSRKSSSLSKNNKILLIAPADLPGGHSYITSYEGKSIVATVPSNGVSKGEKFYTSFMQIPDTATASNTTTSTMTKSAPRNKQQQQLQPKNIPYSSSNTTNTSSYSNSTNTNNSPYVKVRAPASLPAGARFNARCGKKIIVATVPPGGVVKGEVFSVLLLPQP